jgi:hypothetical protein
MMDGRSARGQANCKGLHGIGTGSRGGADAGVKDDAGDISP